MAPHIKFQICFISYNLCISGCCYCLAVGDLREPRLHHALFENGIDNSSVLAFPGYRLLCFEHKFDSGTRLYWLQLPWKRRARDSQVMVGASHECKKVELFSLVWECVCLKLLHK